MNVLVCMRKSSFNNVVAGARATRNSLTFHGENFSVNFIDEKRMDDSLRSKLIKRLDTRIEGSPRVLFSFNSSPMVPTNEDKEIVSSRSDLKYAESVFNDCD